MLTREQLPPAVAVPALCCARRSCHAAPAAGATPVPRPGATAPRSRRHAAPPAAPRLASRRRRSGAAGRRRRRQSRLGGDARAHRQQRGLDRRRLDPRLRYRVEHDRAGDRLRGRCRARPDPHQPPRRHARPGHRGGHLPQPRGGAAVPASIAIRCTTSVSTATTRRSCASSSRRRCRCIPRVRRSAARSAWSATTPASSCRFSPARWRGSTATPPSTASPSTTTSTRSTCRPPPAPPAAPPARPVIDIRGRVVALNAGGANGAASSFYLPLGRVRRALTLIQQGKPVTRGTLYTVFNYTPYDELERLGLDAGHRGRGAQGLPALHRHAGRHRGAARFCRARGVLQPGDILLRVNRPLRDAVRAPRGGARRLGRRGSEAGARTRRQARVREAAGGRSARHHAERLRGVRRRGGEHALLPAGAALQRADSRGVRRQPRLRVRRCRHSARRGDHRRSTAGRPTRCRISRPASRSSATAITPRCATSPSTIRTAASCARSAWTACGSRRATAIATTPRACGTARDLPAGPAPKPPAVSSTVFPHFSDPRLDALAPSLVMVTFDMPYSVSGITERNYHGTGLVVDAQRGLVVVDRNTVPVAVGDVTITFAGTVQVPGTRGVHPPAAQLRGRRLRSAA